MRSEGFEQEIGGTAGARTAHAGAATFTIRQLAREFAVTARTLRFYEEKGLVRPQRRGQERLYSGRDRTRLKYALIGRSIGFSLDEIREMLDLSGFGSRQEAQLRAAREKFSERIVRLERQREAVTLAIAEITHTRNMIDAMLTRRAGDRTGVNRSAPREPAYQRT